MKVIINRFIPFGKRYFAINLFGVVFAKGKCSPRTLNHEKIHTAQIRELGYILFYPVYVMEWLIRILQYGNPHKAYRNISFEREAYANDSDFSYTGCRKPFSFIRYMKQTAK